MPSKIDARITVTWKVKLFTDGLQNTFAALRTGVTISLGTEAI